jgi:hypothetical protein
MISFSCSSIYSGKVEGCDESFEGESATNRKGKSKGHFDIQVITRDCLLSTLFRSYGKPSY